MSQDLMPADSNKTIVEASLDHLHDIIIPDAIGFFPPAPGWYILLLVLLALLFHFSAQAYNRYKKSHYKREALKELPNYTKESRENVMALLALAKRVGIFAYGRAEVAGLSESKWWSFMEKHSKVSIGTQTQEAIYKLLYDESYKMHHALHADTLSFVTHWINTHKVAHHV